MAMRRTAFTAVVALLLLAVPAAVCAQGKPPKPASIAISPRTPLAFGSIIQTGNGGSVSINTDGTRSIQGVYATAEAWSPAVFDVRVEGANRYSILLPSSTTLVSDAGDQMVVDAFVSAPAVEGRVNQGTNLDELTCGATLRLDGSQRPGTYRGTYLVVVTILE